MLQTCDDLFMAALVALDPPMEMETAPEKLGRYEGLSEHVAEYNAFVRSLGFLVMPGYSYAEWSWWFHGNRKNKNPLTHRINP